MMSSSGVWPPSMVYQPAMGASSIFFGEHGAGGIVGTQHASRREHDTRKRGAVHAAIHNATHYCNLPVRYTPDTSRTRSTRSRNFIRNATCWACRGKVVVEHRDAGLGRPAKTALVEQRIASLEQRRHGRLVELALAKGADGLELGLGLPPPAARRRANRTHQPAPTGAAQSSRARRCGGPRRACVVQHVAGLPWGTSSSVSTNLRVSS